MSIYFVAGIDTDAGKSFATGLMAKYLHSKGVDVVTQKFAQTGCKGISEDIQTHRNLMGIDLMDVDRDGTTCPFVFDYPASPHLAAEMQNKTIDLEKIEHSTKTLNDKFELVLLEGVGGLNVPITLDYSLLDYLEEKRYPTILVSSSKLGSINHTLLSLEILQKRNIPLHGLIYNHFPADSEFILKDSVKVFEHYLNKMNFDCPIVEIPVIENFESARVDFSKFF
ncbi:dethiobiotin synthase [Marinifilum caeruleilacunae]|uniref:ATP-dependent dethiobiotin synthetase BioD n=1 Tax=Marinifilum caeruleilacunae TaxID=2499076 RepID=A0ABX1WQG2_9BACT|nr:dethiobiotin synthase [Marinifilum caeruleilacunae]NOU58222.1 ATP-dependent dethiobiotin synthetase BioD [Marinifilum caeruleilacunae]